MAEDPYNIMCAKYWNQVAPKSKQINYEKLDDDKVLEKLQNYGVPCFDTLQEYKDFYEEEYGQKQSKKQSKKESKQKPKQKKINEQQKKIDKDIKKIEKIESEINNEIEDIQQNINDINDNQEKIIDDAKEMDDEKINDNIDKIDEQILEIENAEQEIAKELEKKEEIIEEINEQKQELNDKIDDLKEDPNDKKLIADIIDLQADIVENIIKTEKLDEKINDKIEKIDEIHENVIEEQKEVMKEINNEPVKAPEKKQRKTKVYVEPEIPENLENPKYALPLNKYILLELKEAIRKYNEKHGINLKIGNKNKRSLIEMIEKYKIPVERISSELKKQLTMRGKIPVDKLDGYIPEQYEEDCIERSKNRLEDHQYEFVKSFIYSDLRGAVMDFPVGTGKTLTAITCAMCYLDLFPTNFVDVITPASTLKPFNDAIEFVYGGYKRDPRFRYWTYDSYARRKEKCKNALMIVDEAHNLRSIIKSSEEENAEGKTVVNVTSGKKSYDILEFCGKFAHKVLLLTANPMVNGPYDLENLCAMIDGRNPIKPDIFNKDVIRDEQNFKNYFQCKFSIYHPDYEWYIENFPEKREQFVNCVMSGDYEEEYLQIAHNEGISGSENFDSENLASFYNGVRRASSGLGNGGPKIDWTYKKIVNEPNAKFILYSNFLDTGSYKIMKKLNDAGIRYGSINGSVSLNKRKQLVDEYNDNKFINGKLDENKIRVIIISKAGAEGLNLFETTNMIIIDPSWNESIHNQIIARSIRFRSHINLPREKRFVNVYRLVATLNNEESQEGFEELKERFINFEDRKPPMYHINQGIDIYLYNFAIYKQKSINETMKRLENVADLNICAEKSYKKYFEKPIEEKEEELGHPLTYRELVDVKSKIINDNVKKALLKMDVPVSKEDEQIDKLQGKIKYSAKHDISEVSKGEISQFNAFFTPFNVAKSLVAFSDIKKETNPNIKVLEPTAGIGHIIYAILRANHMVNIDAIEYNTTFRNVLQKNIEHLPNVKIMEKRNFLEFLPSDRYDYAIMNPPFHIEMYKGNKKQTFYDIDFVKRAYALLKPNGVLVAITSIAWTFHERGRLKELREWLYDHDVWYDKDSGEEHNVKLIKWETGEGELAQSQKTAVNTIMIKIFKYNNEEDDELLQETNFNT